MKIRIERTNPRHLGILKTNNSFVSFNEYLLDAKLNPWVIFFIDESAYYIVWWYAYDMPHWFLSIRTLMKNKETWTETGDKRKWVSLYLRIVEVYVKIFALYGFIQNTFFCYHISILFLLYWALVKIKKMVLWLICKKRRGILS